MIWLILGELWGGEEVVGRDHFAVAGKGPRFHGVVLVGVVVSNLSVRSGIKKEYSPVRRENIALPITCFRRGARAIQVMHNQFPRFSSLVTASVVWLPFQHASMHRRSASSKPAVINLRYRHALS